MFTLKNEFIVPPLKLGYTAGDGKVNNRHLEFYDLRSKHAGAVTPEPLYLDKGLRELPTQMGIDCDDKLEGLQKLTNLLHRNGAQAIAHLNHPGRMVNPKIPGNYFWSSSPNACENGGATPETMDHQMMDEVIRLFKSTAMRAEKAGFDNIELQFGHGYLMAQFLSPAVNKRDDEYNGSLENRARFPLRVMNAVRKAVTVPVIARVSGEEMMPGGFSFEEMQQFAMMLEKAGADALHVTAGSACSTPPWFFQHMFIPKGKTWEFASRMKEKCSIPVIFVGQINTFEDINRLKKEHEAEYIAVGRALVADPDFLGKYMGTAQGQPRPCLACSDGCLGNVKKGKGLGCVVNPAVNTTITPAGRAKTPKKIAVIGAGLAGMQAAITLRERGMDVTVYEKQKAGGQFNLAYLPPKKESLKKIIDFYEQEMDRLNIRLIHQEVTSGMLDEEGYDEMVMATGAIPLVPPIKGLKKFYWTEFLNDDQLPENQKVLIIGGGLIGLEIASKLADTKNEVIIVEMMEEVARGMEMIEKKMTLKKLSDKQIQIFTNQKVTKIIGKTVLLEDPQEKITKLEGIEKIIISTGMKSHLPFEPGDHIPVHYIGDAKKPGKAEDAIRDAYTLGNTI